MSRLNKRGWKILCAEVERCAGNDEIAGQIQRDIVLKRFDKLRSQSGSPVSYDELHSCVNDIFPQFSEKALRNASKIHKPNKLIWVGGGIAALGALAGLTWLVNLPYPMVRRPVARVAPMLLLPSYISMDRNYREAIAHVEQADQLVNSATSEADILLGDEKVKLAQANLDQLPVWFLGYEPVTYCNLMGCSWRFTFDEFQAARAKVGRMEAQIFQEKNALTQGSEAQNAIAQAKQNYSQATNPTQQRIAIDAWQAGLDQLQQVPSTTLAGKTAQSAIAAHQRDFQQVTGFLSASNRTNTYIGAAKQFAFQAAQASQNPPHPAIKWQQVEDLWNRAIQQLEQVNSEDSGYLQAQELLAQYSANQGQIKIRRQLEEESVQILEQAQQKIQILQANANTWDRNKVTSELEGIINQLEKVKPGTTAYPKASELLGFAKNKLQQVNN